MRASSVTRKPRSIPFLRLTGFVVRRRTLAACKPRAIGFSGKSGHVSGSHCANSSRQERSALGEPPRRHIFIGNALLDFWVLKSILKFLPKAFVSQRKVNEIAL